MNAVVTAIKRPKSLGSMIDGIWELRESKRKAEAVVKEIEAEIADSEKLLMERLDHEGVDKSSGKAASVSISESIVANIVDFDALCKYVKKSGNWQLFQRRISDTSARELFETKGQVPGLEPFKKRKLNIRTIS